MWVRGTGRGVGTGVGEWDMGGGIGTGVGEGAKIRCASGRLLRKG